MASYADLEAAKREAEEAINQPVPEKRFGSGYDVNKYQQQILANKSAAEQNLREVARVQAARDLQGQQQEQYQQQVKYFNAYNAVQAIAERSLDRYGSDVYSAAYEAQAKRAFSNAGLKAIDGRNLYRRFIDANEVKAPPHVTGGISGTPSVTDANLSGITVGQPAVAGLKLKPELMNIPAPTVQPITEQSLINAQFNPLTEKQSTTTLPFKQQASEFASGVSSTIGTSIQYGISNTPVVGKYLQVVEKVAGFEPQSAEIKNLRDLQEQQNKKVEAFNKLVDEGKLTPEEAQQRSDQLTANQNQIDEQQRLFNIARLKSPLGYFETAQGIVAEEIKSGFKSSHPVISELASIADDKIINTIANIKQTNPSVGINAVSFAYNVDKAIVNEAINKPLETGGLVALSAIGEGAFGLTNTGLRAVRIIRGAEEIGTAIPEIEKVSVSVKGLSAEFGLTVPKFEKTVGFLSAAKTGIALGSLGAVGYGAYAQATEQAREQFLGQAILSGSAISLGVGGASAAVGSLDKYLFEPVSVYKQGGAVRVGQAEFIQEYNPELPDLTIGKLRVGVVKEPTSILAYSRFDKFVLKTADILEPQKSISGKKINVLPSIDYLEPFKTRKATPIIIDKGFAGVGASNPLFVKNGRVFDVADYINTFRETPVKVELFKTSSYHTKRLVTLEGGVISKDVAEAIIGKSGSARLKQALAESKAGVPVSTEQVDLILKEVDLYGAMKLTDLGQVNRKGKLKPTNPAKNFETFILRSTSKEVLPAKEGFTILKGETAFYDTTLPTKSLAEHLAEGKTFESRRKIPIVKSITKIKESSFITELDASLKPASPLEQVQRRPPSENKAITLAGDTIAKQIAKETKSSLARVRQNLKTATTITPASKYSTGAFAGLGLYERTQSVQAFTVKQTITPQERFVTSERLTPLETGGTKLIPKESARELPREIVREVPRELNRELTRQTIRLVERQVPKQTQRTPPRNPPFPNTDLPPQPKGNAKSISGLLKRYTSSNANFGRYVVQERRRKVFKEIARRPSLQEAIDIGEAITKKNLGASFRILGASKGEKATVNFSEFRLPANKRYKESPYTFIQRKGGKEGGIGRLAYSGELSEIQIANKIKRRFG